VARAEFQEVLFLLIPCQNSVLGVGVASSLVMTDSYSYLCIPQLRGTTILSRDTRPLPRREDVPLLSENGDHSG